MIQILSYLCIVIKNKQNKGRLYIKEYTNINVNFTSSSITHNLRRLSLVEAYQRLISFISMMIHKYTRLIK